MEKITSNNPESKSLDILTDNIEKLKEIFPEVVSENRVDFEKLQLLLNDAITPKDDLYGLNWWGKNDAIREAMKPSLGTLRPDKDESVNWGTTENLYIEGDNLEVLKLLQKSYNGKVKMIYIDPPYNTGKDFVYKDNFKDNLKNYLAQTGQVNDEGIKQSTNTKDDGRYHDNWLNMMYPRLKLARNLLKEDGIIFVSIGDDELYNLKSICDEIFGSLNYVSTFIWNCSTGGGIRPKHINRTHEYMLFYAKNINLVTQLNAQLSKEAVSQYKLSDHEGGVYREKDFVFKNNSTNINQRYEIICPDGEVVIPKNGYIYRFIRESFDIATTENKVVFKKTTNGPLIKKDGTQANWNIYIKKYLGDGKGSPLSIFPKDIVGMYNNGTANVQNLFSNTRVFENVKSTKLIEYVVDIICQKEKHNEIVLDFFSGSATSAHAVMQLNAEDGGNRKHIMVQLPELTDEKSEAYKAGFKTIAEIGKERIRRAGNKILSEQQEALKKLQGKAVLTEEEQTEKERLEQVVEKLDVGFKVFKLDSSNIETWDTEMPQTDEEIQYRLEHSAENIKDGRKEDDLLYEFLLKQGHLLTAPIEEKKLGNDTIYNVNQGELFVCLTDKITSELVTVIGEWAKESISNSIVDIKPVLILKDNAFLGNDSLKTNTELTLCSQFGFAKINTI